MTEIALGIGVVAVVLVFQGFFSGSEMALVAANRAKLEHAAKEGSRGAAKALDLLEHEDQLLGTCLIGTNISLITGATIVSGMVLSTGRPEWMATLLFAPFALLLGEAIPKTVYQHHATTIAPVVAWPLRGAQILFTPMLWIVGGWASVLKRLVGRDTHPSREELMMLLDADEGSDIDERERDIIRNVLDMRDTTVEEAMTPLVDVQAVSETATVADATQAVLSSGHSRIPVYRERIDNIVGIVSHADLLFRGSSSDPLGPIVREVMYVPESKRAPEMLEELRGKGSNLAIVVDEYGGAIGLVTQEDLLEEFVGEIRDERDADGPGIRQLSDRVWRIQARAEIDEVVPVIGCELPEGDYETVAGLLLHETQRIPATGETVRVGDLTFHIEQSSARAILQVRLTLPPK